MKLVWTQPAVSDLESIYDFISRDSETYASHFAQAIMAVLETLPQSPRRGRVVPEADDEDIREIISGSYRLIYRIGDKRIEVLGIVHGRRDLGGMDRKPWETE